MKGHDAYILMDNIIVIQGIYVFELNLNYEIIIF